MPVAIVRHDRLKSYAAELGFPMHTKVKCDAGFNGYAVWDKFIRENVEWVIETAFDPDNHVKITESAQLVGELKDPWELRCQKFIEGDVEYNTFKAIEGDTTHVNRQAIQVAVSNANFKYKVDFEIADDGSVVTHNALAVAIYDKAEDSSLSYTSELEVAQLWTTKVEHIDIPGQPILFKRAYANDPEIEESYPWIAVGELDAAEYELWVEHNVKPVTTLEDGSGFDARAIDERTESFVAVSKPADISQFFGKVLHSTGSAEPIYPEVDDTAVSGDVNA